MSKNLSGAAWKLVYIWEGIDKNIVGNSRGPI